MSLKDIENKLAASAMTLLKKKPKPIPEVPVYKRPIALTDIETTGLQPGKHEIIEIGVVLFDPITLNIIDTLNMKVVPTRIELADEAALKCNGYREENWRDAVPLKEAMERYSEFTKGAVFCAFNATFDWGFLNEAFFATDVEIKMDYHRLDLLSIAWERGLKSHGKWSLKSCCELFGTPPESDPHMAINGARAAYELFRKLQTRDRIHGSPGMTYDGSQLRTHLTHYSSYR